MPQVTVSRGMTFRDQGWGGLIKIVGEKGTREGSVSMGRRSCYKLAECFEGRGLFGGRCGEKGGFKRAIEGQCVI